MQTGCVHCGQQHLLKDEVLAKHNKVQFRCTRCGQTTIVELKKRTDETVVISPMPSFARADASTQNLRLPLADEGLTLPAGVAVVLTVESGPERGKSFTLASARAVLGRKGADIALEDPEISRHHCVLEVRDQVVSLKDLSSTNGTFFEEERERAAKLHHGDLFRTGRSTIRLSHGPAGPVDDELSHGLCDRTKRRGGSPAAPQIG